MKRNLVMIFCCMFAVGLITMTGCKKKDTAVDNDTSGAIDNTLAENTSNDVVNIGAQASEQGNLSTYREASNENLLSTCAATVVRDSIAKTITVTFNPNVTCLDGRTRSGSITYDYHLSPAGAVHFRDPGFTFTVSTNGYVVDGNQVNIINKTVTNTTANGFNPATTNETWSISANIKITKANGNVITWDCNRTTTLLNTSDSNVYRGSAIPIAWTLARIEVNGAANGTRLSGAESFSATATNMVRDFTCSPIGSGGKHPWISGTLDYQPPSPKYLRHIDFGTGTCDLNATVTINGATYDITLP